MKIGEQHINKVFVVESLHDEDISTGLEIKKHIEFIDSSVSIEYSKCSGEGDFLRNVDDICDSTYSEDGILLFIEVHGSKEGIDLGGELVAWGALTEKLQLINEKCHMGLAVVFSCCYGINFFRQTSILGRSPYYVMFGVDNIIFESRLLKMNKELVNGFYGSKSLEEIVDNANIPLNLHDINLTFLEAGELLIGAFTNYFTKQLSVELLLARFEETYQKYLRITSNPMTYLKYKDHYFSFIFNIETLENGFNDIRDKFLMTDLDSSLYERFCVDFDEVYDQVNVKYLIENARREVFLYK